MTIPPPDLAGLVMRDLSGLVRGPFAATFRAGECAVIAGRSGVGKSLFLRMVADLDPNRGTVLLDGADRDAMPAPLWRRRVTYAAAESGWWASSVTEHMRDRAAASVAFAAVGLAPALLDAPPDRLSTGERQRAGLVRALIQNPAFLLLDEPTSALDAATTAQVEDWLGEAKRRGLGLVVVSHSAEQAARIADRRLVMTPDGLGEVSS